MVQEVARQVLHHLNHTLSLFALAVFQIGSHIYTQVSLDQAPICASPIARMTGVCRHTQILLVEMESCKLFAWSGFQPQSSRSLPPE
jgi:hypothetical protein